MTLNEKIKEMENAIKILDQKAKNILAEAKIGRITMSVAKSEIEKIMRVRNKASNFINENTNNSYNSSVDVSNHHRRFNEQMFQDNQEHQRMNQEFNNQILLNNIHNNFQ